MAKRKPPTLTLPPTQRFGNRVAQLVPRWLPLFLKGGREKLVSEAHSNHLFPYSPINLFTFKKAAFTLAEVLITLGIIGIVAAMTIPTLISNYTKKETVSKLKQSYSILAQSITRAQVDNGDVSNWGLAYIYESSIGSLDQKEILTNFFNTYLKPYVKVSEVYGYTNPILLPRPYSHSIPNSTVVMQSALYWFTLSNNVLVGIGLGTGCFERDNDGNCLKRGYTNIIFKTDVNGFNSPNIIGKDVFLMTLDVRANKFGFYQYPSYTSRNQYLRACRGEVAADDVYNLCGQLIFLDGWEIKDDYPWL